MHIGLLAGSRLRGAAVCAAGEGGWRSRKRRRRGEEDVDVARRVYA